MDEELFMSKEEKGVYNQCLNTDLVMKSMIMLKNLSR